MAEKRAMLVTLDLLEQGLTRTKREYLAAIARGGYVSFRVSETVPEASEAQADILYLVRDGDTGLYAIYALVDGSVERLGDTAVDLEGYVTREELDSAVAAGVKKALNDGAVASDEEAAEMIEEIFAEMEPSISEADVATDAEVEELLKEIFG